MRQKLLPLLGIVAVVLISAEFVFLCAASTSVFFIFSDGKNLSQNIQLLEKSGARVRHVVPPKILIADLGSVGTTGLVDIQKSFTGVVPISELEPLGPISVAAGVQWNKSLLARSGESGSHAAFSAMSASVSKETLPAPQNLQAQESGREILCTWNAVPAALIYELQLGADPQFSRILADSRSDKTSLTLPVDSTVAHSVFIRIRSIDRPSAEDAKLDVIGEWSSLKTVVVQSPPLQETGTTLIPTSPVEGMETVGFNVVMEWSGNDLGHSRIQVSLSPTFDSTLVDCVVPEKEYAVPSSALHVGDTLHWRVKNWGDSEGPWTVHRSVVVGAPKSSVNDAFINPESPQ
jgi:hypothetical protein